jgi:CelD/BcsL family acetyltransferase involved in cellulose biosynthesis
MTYFVREETLDSLSFYWQKRDNPLNWDCFFVLPIWLKAWWEIFGKEKQPFLRTFWEGGELLGIAPLMLEENKALFMGDPDVCDCQDFVIATGKEEIFFNAFLDEIEKQEIKELDLSTLRPDSSTLLYLLKTAKARGYKLEKFPDGLSMEMNLPKTWEDYLNILASKHRHETRRKLRRLEEAAEIHYRVLEDPKAVKQEEETFLRLFRMSRPDKTHFLNQEMESFFRSLMKILSENRLLKLCFLDIDHEPVSAVLCFDFNETIYLYNNGFNPEYRRFSAGLLSKVLNIKYSIACGRKKFDFLKGNEKYKRHLGGEEVSLSRCRIIPGH